MSAPAIASFISLSLSRAASSPFFGIDPAPNPLVVSLPTNIFFFATVYNKSCASVLIAIVSVPLIPTSFILFNVLFFLEVLLCNPYLRLP